tara:strand:- start:1410 stop:1697 length:288 start_codon:yes stop_codon:yes gene_type:complete
MLGLIGYALLSIITALILSPVIKFGKGFSSYLCVFGLVYLVVLFIAPISYFEPNWFKYVGYFIGFSCIIIFIYIVWKQMKKQQQLNDLMEENEQN